MIKCPHYEPYYNEVERSKCMACPIKCYTFLKEEVSRLSKDLANEQLAHEETKHDCLVWFSYVDPFDMYPEDNERYVKWNEIRNKY